MSPDIETILKDLDDLEGLNYYSYDPAFTLQIRRYLGEDAFAFFQPYFGEMGELAGVKVAPLAEIINDPRHYPQLENYDRHGNRIDEIELHPAGAKIRERAFASGMIGLPYEDRIRSLGRKVPRMVRFGLGYLFAQAEVSSYYEIIASDACVTALERFGNHDIKRKLLPMLTSMDPRQPFQRSDISFGKRCRQRYRSYRNPSHRRSRKMETQRAQVVCRLRQCRCSVGVGSYRRSIQRHRRPGIISRRTSRYHRRAHRLENQPFENDGRYGEPSHRRNRL